MRRICITGANVLLKQQLAEAIAKKYNIPLVTLAEGGTPPDWEKEFILACSPVDDLTHLLVFSDNPIILKPVSETMQYLQIYNNFTHHIILSYKATGSQDLREWALDAIYERIVTQLLAKRKPKQLLLTNTNLEEQMKTVGAFLTGIILTSNG